MSSNPLQVPTFRNPDLLTTALTHRSALNERLSSSTQSYERLEFLGDAVLELSATNFLFQKLQTEPEGVLTAFRSALVKTTMLAQIAKQIGLGEHIIMSRGEEGTGGRNNPSLLADVFEAVIGALYLDQGFEAVDQFLQLHLFPQFDFIRQHDLHRDFKSSLQELIQADGRPTPVYKVHSEQGPDHEKIFTVGVYVDTEQLAEATGTSKQRAEQAAAKVALEKIQGK